MLISFDVWGTLWTANPLFREKKIQLVREVLLEYGAYIPDRVIDQCFSKVKKSADKLVERYGCQPNRHHLFCQLADEIRMSGPNIVGDIVAFMEAYERLFEQFPPIVIPGVAEKLTELKNNGIEYTFSSNTLLIPGKTIRTSLLKVGLVTYNQSTGFSTEPRYFRFSDELGYSKPHENMFNKRATWHIGDNPITDGACEKYGISFLQVNQTPGNTVADMDIETLLNKQKK